MDESNKISNVKGDYSDLGTLLAINPNTNRLYSVTERINNNTVSVVDTMTDTLINTTKILPDDRKPMTAVINPATNKLYIANTESEDNNSFEISINYDVTSKNYGDDSDGSDGPRDSACNINYNETIMTTASIQPEINSNIINKGQGTTPAQAIKDRLNGFACG